MLKSGTQEDGEVLPTEEPVQASSISLDSVSSEVTLEAGEGIGLGNVFSQENGVFAEMSSELQLLHNQRIN